MTGQSYVKKLLSDEFTMNCVKSLTVILSISVASIGLAQPMPSTKQTSEQQVAFSRDLVKIGAGVVVGDQAAARWNRPVMLAKPRIASGDVSAISESIRNAVSTFIFTVAATVDTDPQSPNGRFRLAEVGLGYSVSVGKQLIIVHSDSYKSAGVELGFFQRQVLSENQKQLETMSVVGRGNSLMIFDAPAMLVVNNSHQEFVIRHLVWIEPASGKLAAIYWLLNPGKPGNPGGVLSVEPMRWIDPEVVEDRVIHVDSNEFTLGIPTKRAFAVNSLPPGRKLEWNKESLQTAGAARYDLSSIQSLMGGIDKANRVSLKPAPAVQ